MTATSEIYQDPTTNAFHFLVVPSLSRFCDRLLTPGLCTSDGSTSVEMCHQAVHNSSVIMGYGELLR